MTDATDFLYPFIESNERDPATLLADLARSAREKQSTSTMLRATTLEKSEAALERAAAALAGRLDAGGRMFVFGNGGSSTDAASLAGLFARPPHGRPVAARTLVADAAVLTALGNDVGFDLVFSRQLIAHGRRGDVAVGLSTSGTSRNVLAAFETARETGLLTIGLAGYGGGAMATSPHVEHCLVVHADSVHRIQEAQAALGFALWQRTQTALGAEVGERSSA